MLFQKKNFGKKTNFLFEKKRKKLLVGLTKHYNKLEVEGKNKNENKNIRNCTLISKIALKKKSSSNIFLLSTLKADAKYRAGSYSKKKELKGLLNLKNSASLPLTPWLKLSNNNNKPSTKRNLVRIKRKYLLLKGFYRKYKNLKIKIQFSEQNPVYSPIQIKYKKINLLFKHRPIAYYFAETCYNSLEFTLTNDVDFLFFPYKTFFDFKLLSSMCTK